jgi:hypothetical protein
MERAMSVIEVDFPGNIAAVRTIPDLRALPSGSFTYNDLYVVTGKGLYTWVPDSFAVDDGDKVIKPNDLTPLQVGRWLFGPQGSTGPADNTYTTLAALLASDPSRKSARLVPEAGETEPAGNFSYVNGAWVRQQADGVGYKAPAVAAQTQSQGEKNQQTVDLYDALTPAMRASVRAGNVAVDCAPALNAIINFATGAESTGDATGGTTLYIKGGRYLVSSSIKNTYRRDAQIVDDGDLRRLNIVGDGSNNTTLFYNGAANTPALEVAGYRGTNVNDGVSLRQSISGLRIRRFPINAKTGTGVRISYAEGMSLDDVIIDGFETNLFATDVLEFFAEKLFLKDSVIGGRFQLSDFTNPNVMRFDGGGVAGASQIGLHLVRPANVILDSMRFEGNGFDSNFIGILAELGTPEGGFSLGVYNSYFENNMGDASLKLAHGFAADALVDFQRNTVHNDSATRFMQHHIDYFRSGAAASANSTCVIAHGPQRYRNIGNYVSSPSRSAVRLQTTGAFLVEHAGNRYPTANERPETNGFASTGLTYQILQASIFEDGTYTQDWRLNINVDHVEHPSTGIYRVFYKNVPQDPGGVIVNATIATANGFVTVANRSGAYIEMQTFDRTGGAFDRAFMLDVRGNFS